MAADSIANATDSEFLAIVDQLRTALAANPANYPAISPAMMTALDTFHGEYNNSLNAHIAAQANARSKRTAKDTKRDEGEAMVRSIRNICKATGTDGAKMATLGIPASSATAPANATTPAGSVDTSQRLRHTINWTDTAAVDNKRKPRGAMGAEIWVKIGDPLPGNEKDCSFLTLDSATPYVAHYEPADVGKTAHYMLRWRMRDGSTSAWGETISATITG